MSFQKKQMSVGLFGLLCFLVTVLVMPLVGMSETINENATVKGVTDQGKFGQTVSMHLRKVLIGQPNAGDGRVFLHEFNKNNSDWEEKHTIDGSTLNATDFGQSVSISGGVMAIGASGDSDLSAGGVVYLFEKDGNGAWNLAIELQGPSRADGDGFGKAVALKGSYLLVGAPNVDTDNDSSNGVPGAAYLYQRTESWASNPIRTIFPEIFEDTEFGTSVSISWKYMAVGAPSSGDATKEGGVYVYDYENSTPARIYRGQGAEDHFGFSVAIYAFKRTGGLIVGAPQTGSGNGAAYVYVRDRDSGWPESSWDVQYTGPGGTANFGNSVAIWGSSALVGAPGADGEAAYLYRKVGGDWESTPEEILGASDGIMGDRFGQAVSLSGARAVVGAPEHDNLENTGTLEGAAYLYGPFMGVKGHKFCAKKEEDFANVVEGGPGNDGTVLDPLQGTDNSDLILGYGGDDRIRGLKGNDCIMGGAGNDNIDGGHGHDVIFGGRGEDSIRGNLGNDWIHGGSGKDKLWGGSGNDTLRSGRGSGSGVTDILYGGPGWDYLVGALKERQRKIINGGSGVDSCMYKDFTKEFGDVQNCEHVKEN